MANWGKIGSRGEVEDRRGFAPALAGGIGLTSIVVIFLFSALTGTDPTALLNQVQSEAPQTQQVIDTSFDGTDTYEEFASTVLGSTTDLWRKTFEEQNKTYSPPKLVLFRTATQSECGTATSEVGPHYCPFDKTIYLDETFFDELVSRFGAHGGDVAEAYVIAHEVGHHAQNMLGTLNSQQRESNQGTVATELQADCYAGLWAYSIKNDGVLESGEIQEALDAASAVGDDRIQKRVEGYVNPETWTHGSSAQRVQAFTTGYETGLLSKCNFN